MRKRLDYEMILLLGISVFLFMFWFRFAECDTESLDVMENIICRMRGFDQIGRGAFAWMFLNVPVQYFLAWRLMEHTKCFSVYILTKNGSAAHMFLQEGWNTVRQAFLYCVAGLLPICILAYAVFGKTEGSPVSLLWICALYALALAESVFFILFLYALSQHFYISFLISFFLQILLILYVSFEKNRWALWLPLTDTLLYEGRSYFCYDWLMAVKSAVKVGLVWLAAMQMLQKRLEVLIGKE